MKLKDLIRILESNKFYLVRQSGHMIFSNGIKSVAIPRSRELNGKTVYFILKNAELGKVA